MNSKVADLKRQLKILRSKPPAGKTGRARVDLLNDLGMALYKSEPFMTEAYAKEAMVLSERIGYMRGKARSNKVIGIAIASRGKYYESMEHFNIAREIYTELDDRRGIAGTFTNIGVVYSDQSRLDLALDHHLKALSIYEEINDRNSIAHSFNCIGVVFRKRNNLEKAEYYYQKALKIREETGNIPGCLLYTSPSPRDS